MSDAAAFELSPANAGRLWFMDLIHSPRALPPLSADLDAESSAESPIGMDVLVVNGYSYRSPTSMTPPAQGPEPGPGEALRNWEDTILPEAREVYRRFREADFEAMSSAGVLAFLERERPAVWTAMRHTIESAMELGPDAERLSRLLEEKLGADGELLAATILHGGGSETRALGREVDALAASARQTPAAERALRARDFSAALAVADEPWAGALAGFLAEHEDEVALWSEIHEPAWNEDPVQLMRLVASTLGASRPEREDASAEALADARNRLAPEDLPAFEEAVALSRDYVPVIEHRARWQLKLVGGLRRPYIALGRKLVAAGFAASADDVFFLHLDELERVAAGGLDVRALVAERRTEWQRNLALKPPLTLGLPIPIEMLGAASPMMRRMFGAVALAASTARVINGIGASSGVATGRARVVGGLADADDLQEGDILVCPSTSPPWTPYFAIVAAVVTDAGGTLSHAAIEAREYGIPAVVGTREGTRRIPDGALITVDGGAGTVTIEG